MDQRKMQQPPYIGSKISLISKLDIRYQGTLYTVDPIDSTITLAKVQSYGTEDRRTAVFVQPKNDVYDFIIFKASDIKDLIVCEQPKANSPENIVGANLPYDPAIVSISKNPPPEPKLPPKQLLDRRLPNFLSQQQHHRTKHLSMSYIYDGPQVPMDKDYDFEKANEQFHEKIVRDNMKGKENLDQNQQGETKEEEMKEQTDPVEVLVQRNSSVFEEFYNKNNSFFDNISCDALEKQSGNNVRPDWKRERQTNQETFGHSAVRSLFYQQRRSGIIRGFTHGGSGVAVGRMMMQMPLRYGNGTNYNSRYPTNYYQMKYQ